MNKGVFFAIQGEGRGHLTQALALKHQLDKNHIPLLGVLVGKSEHRELPNYFIKTIGAEIYQLPSPNFVYDKSKKGIDPLRSVIHWASNFNTFRKSAHRLVSIIEELKPALIINFFEPLVPISQWMSRINTPVFSVAHQYIFEHDAYRFPRGNWMQKNMLASYTRFTGKGSRCKYALSLYPLPNLVSKKIKVIPPLLREAITHLEKKEDNFTLAYILNEGYIQELLSYRKKFPGEVIHCFTDKKGLVEKEEICPGLFLHPLNDVLFMEKMASCKILLTTAGFESIAEAMYLNKPVLCVPVKGHFEQFCNSRDVAFAAAGGYSDTFDPHLIPDVLNNYKKNKNFEIWYHKYNHILSNDIKELINKTK
jgi:uncharacterized protein (TIGR00661 family)